MSRLLPGLLVMGAIGLASCTGSPDQEQITQLQAEVAELRAAIQSQQEAPAAGDADADPETADDAVSEDIAVFAEQHEQSEDHGEPSQTFVRPTGTVIGVIQAIKDSGGRHINLSILAPGEERPRDYFVYDKQDVLAEVRMGKVGDRVEIGWVQTNHGPAIETFEVLE